MAIFLITAPSGVGKTTIAQEIQRYGDWHECISHTTRPMRYGEVNGKTYYYISKEEFLKMDNNNEFAERVTYDGNFYGISKAEIERVMSFGSHVYIIVEYEGYKQVKEKFPDAIGIFMHMSEEECMANMLFRGDSISKAQTRMLTYNEEMLNRGQYDYVIKNVRGKMKETISVIRAIISQYD